jgi:hypothetical protein
MGVGPVERISHLDDKRRNRPSKVLLHISGKATYQELGQMSRSGFGGLFLSSLFYDGASREAQEAALHFANDLQNPQCA